jgi:hypothetical protein
MSRQQESGVGGLLQAKFALPTFTISKAALAAKLFAILNR